MSSPKYEIYQDAAGEHRWRLKAANGRVVASGEGYRTKAGAERGVEAHRKAARTARVAYLKIA